MTETTGSTTVTYGYDSNGSLTSQSGGGSSRTQSWDARGRLSGAVVDGVTTSYTYTSDGIRSSVTENGTKVDYLIDVMTPSGYAQVVEELTSGVLAVRYTYGGGLDPIGETRSSTTSLYLSDGHSGVRQAISLAGVVLLAQRFDAYGVSVAKVGTLNTAIGYRGERYDATLGQYYLRARYYDPRQGRFTGVDPYSGNLSDPSQVMRYGYAGANPVWAMDPSGMSLSSMASGIGIVGGLSGIAFGVGSAFSSFTGKGTLWWEDFIPGWGSGRNYALDMAAGDYGSAAFNGTLGILDLIGIGWAGTFLRNSRIARLASNSALGRIASQASAGAQRTSARLFDIFVTRLLDGAEMLSSVGAKSFDSTMIIPNVGRFESFLNSFGIRLVEDGSGSVRLLPNTYAGTVPLDQSSGFIGEIIFRRVAANEEHRVIGQPYTMLHELIHGLHLTLIGRAGGPSMRAWAAPEAEQFVYDVMRLFFWDGLTEAQKRHAANYARREGATNIW